MIWQDWVFTVGNVVMTLALIPAVTGKRYNIPLVTAIPTATGLSLFAVAFGTLELIASSISVGFSALGWWCFVLGNPALYRAKEVK